MHIATEIAAGTVTVDYGGFAKALVNACKIIERNSHVPMLNMVQIETEPGAIKLTGTDLDIFTTTTVEASVVDRFSFLVDAGRLKATMDKAKSAHTISFTKPNDEKVVARIGQMKLELQLEHAVGEFPPEDSLGLLRSSGHRFTMRRAFLLEALEKVSIAMSNEEDRYYLNGIFLHHNETTEKLTFVATDGHRMCRYEINPPRGAASIPPVIIPRKTVGEVLRLLRRKGCPDEIAITVMATGIAFRVGDNEFVRSKLIDGSFPDYSRVMPAQSTLSMTVDPASIVEASKQVGAVGSDRGQAVRIEIAEDEVTFSCTDETFGSASMTVKCTATGREVIGVNNRYLQELMGLIEGEATVEIADPRSPMKILDGDCPAATYVLMPMRV